MIIVGPPCGTFSLARFNRKYAGPRPVRTRGRYEWGIPGLKPWEAAQVNEANLIINTVALCEAVSARGGVHLIEHPEIPGQEPYPSLWNTSLMTGLEERTSAIRHLFDQCMRGRDVKKSICISGTAAKRRERGPRCDGCHTHALSGGQDKSGAFRTSRLQTYPSGVSEFIAECDVTELEAMQANGTGPGGGLREHHHCRISHWSTKGHNDDVDKVAVLNEEAVRGTRVMLDGKQSAVYLHVDDGVVATVRRPGKEQQCLFPITFETYNTCFRQLPFCLIYCVHVHLST